MKKGDLVHIPVSTRLSKYKDNNNAVVTNYKNTDKPLNLLVVETTGNRELGVSFQGETWFLSEKDAYLVEGR